MPGQEVLFSVSERNQFCLISIKVDGRQWRNHASMVRALFQLRVFIAVLALGLAAAFSAAPGIAFAATACSEAASGTEHAVKADVHISDAQANAKDGGHVNWADYCCMSGIAAHCCGFALSPINSEYAVANFTSVRWPVSSAHSVAGMGPFGDFRPPKYIG